MTRGPNVVVFLSDQQRWDTTGVGGNPMGLSPNFDRMARRGTYAPVVITPNPLCAPARAALQTGIFPTASGCFRNQTTLPSTTLTLAGQFRDAGYATGYIGKWHLGDHRSRGPVASDQRGDYEFWLASNALEFTSDAYHTVVYDGDGDPVRLPGYRADALTDAAIRFVADHYDEPFFLFVSLLEPHHQNEVDDYIAPAGYAEQYAGRWLPPDLVALGGGGKLHEQIGGYYGQVKRLDECLGRLHDALVSLDLRDDTIVAVTSDHGCHFRTRAAEYKRTCHDASLRVPFALSGPGFDGGRIVDGPVSTTDLPPTLLDAAGIDVPDGWHGRSLLGDDGRTNDVFFQVSEDEVGRGLRTSRWKYYVVAPEADGWNDADARHYIETELYDLDHDPYELDNLVGLDAVVEIADTLRDTLKRRMVEVGEAAPQIQPAERRGPGRAIAPVVSSLDVTGVRFGHQPK